jgi:Fe-Mn family superoxide dismutase
MFTLTTLPYAAGALAPILSQRTLEIHHGRHHAAYVKTVNDTLAASGAQPGALEEVIARARAEGEAKLFNAAAQAWNHGFFWMSMSPTHREPGGELREAIDAAFGGLDALRSALLVEGTGHFGSGWVWLAADSRGGLKLFSTHDAETPADRVDQTPLLVCDLWEHAYYLDHQNDRRGFLAGWFDSLADWSFAEAQFAARGGSGLWRYPAPEATSAAA